MIWIWIWTPNFFDYKSWTTMDAVEWSLFHPKIHPSIDFHHRHLLAIATEYQGTCRCCALCRLVSVDWCDAWWMAWGLVVWGW